MKNFSNFDDFVFVFFCFVFVFFYFVHDRFFFLQIFHYFINLAKHSWWDLISNIIYNVQNIENLFLYKFLMFVCSFFSRISIFMNCFRRKEFVNIISELTETTKNAILTVKLRDVIKNNVLILMLNEAVNEFRSKNEKREKSNWKKMMIVKRNSAIEWICFLMLCILVSHGDDW